MYVLFIIYGSHDYLLLNLFKQSKEGIALSH